VCQSICQIIKLATIEELRWHMILQPEDLWDFHFYAHVPADVSEEIMLGAVDFDGLFHRPVVKPQDDIVIIVVEVGSSDGDGFVSIVGKNCKRAGGIEADSTNRGRINPILAEHSLDRHADASPDVVGGLFLFSKSTVSLSREGREHARSTISIRVQHRSQGNLQLT
jgi:hypothetical protein